MDWIFLPARLMIQQYFFISSLPGFSGELNAQDFCRCNCEWIGAWGRVVKCDCAIRKKASTNKQKLKQTITELQKPMS